MTILRRCLGLDIGSEKIKLVELYKKGRGNVYVETFTNIDTPTDALDNGKIINSEKLRNSLSKLIASCNCKTDNVVLGLGNLDIVIRKVNLPPLSDKEVAQALNFELADILAISPKELQDVAYSYQIIGRTKKETQLLVVSCQQSFLEPYLDVVRSVGLLPHVVDISAFALPRISPTEDNCCYVDLGANQTTIYAVIGGQFAVYRILPFGGQLIDYGICKAFSVDEAEAKELKHNNNVDYLLLEGTGQKSPLYSIFQQYIGGVLQTLDYLRSQERVSSVADVLNKLVLCGGNALLAGFDQVFQDELDIEVALLEPFSNVDLAIDKQLPHEDSLIYSNAMGLALRGLAE